MRNTTAVNDLLHAAALRLGDRGEAEQLVMHVLGVERAWLYAHAGDAMAADAARGCRALVERRAGGEPVAYLTGRRGFWNLDLDVTAATLIPRPETEILVEQALVHLPTDASVRVADLGTGSGAVALAIAGERPHAQVVATDASEAALAVARGNAERLGLERVEFVLGDWLAPLAARHFDIIVSNPPYVALGDPHLEQGDLRFEPARALVSGGDGLDALRHIARTARAHLADDGWLLLEHGHEQGKAVRGLLAAQGFSGISTVHDLEARERVSAGRRSTGLFRGSQSLRAD